MLSTNKYFNYKSDAICRELCWWGGGKKREGPQKNLKGRNRRVFLLADEKLIPDRRKSMYSQNHGKATCLENARWLFFPGIEKDYGGQ